MTHFSVQNADNSIEMQLRWAGLKWSFAMLSSKPRPFDKWKNGATRNKTRSKEIKTSSRIWGKRITERSGTEG